MFYLYSRIAKYVDTVVQDVEKFRYKCESQNCEKTFTLSKTQHLTFRDYLFTN